MSKTMIHAFREGFLDSLRLAIVLPALVVSALLGLLLAFVNHQALPTDLGKAPPPQGDSTLPS